MAGIFDGITKPFRDALGGGRTTYHVLYNGSTGSWRIRKVDGVFYGVSEYARKSDALKVARRHARNDKPSQIYIHGKNGEIVDESTYGDDPYPPEG